MPLLSVMPQIETLWHSVETGERNGVREYKGVDWEGETAQWDIYRESLKEKKDR